MDQNYGSNNYSQYSYPASYQQNQQQSNFGASQEQTHSQVPYDQNYYLQEQYQSYFPGKPQGPYDPQQQAYEQYYSQQQYSNQYYANSQSNQPYQAYDNYYADIFGSDPFAVPSGNDNYYLEKAKAEEEAEKARKERAGERAKKQGDIAKVMQQEKMKAHQDYVKESMMSEQQKNQKVLEEVLASKDYEQSQKNQAIEKEILSELEQCSLHLNAVFKNLKCRQCKKIREEFEQKKKQKLEEQVQEGGNIKGVESKIPVQQLIHTNFQFPVHGEPAKANLSELLRTNILQSTYFKEQLILLKTYPEIIDELKRHVTYTEPWVVGANGVPSTLFCCLFKLAAMRLTEKHVQSMMKSKESPYIRAAGFLYVRFLSPPEQVYERLSPFLMDDMEFSPSADKNYKTSMGEFVEQLLKEKLFYNTVLPRIPVLIEREIQKKLSIIPERRQRRQENTGKSAEFKKGLIIYAMSKRDEQWHRAKIIGIHWKNIYQKGNIYDHDEDRAHNYTIDDKFFQEDEDEGDFYDEDEKVVRKLQVKFLEAFKDSNNQECFPEEFLGLEDVLLVTQQEEKEDEQKKSRSREKERKEQSKKRSRSRNKDKQYSTQFDFRSDSRAEAFDTVKQRGEKQQSSDYRRKKEGQLQLLLSQQQETQRKEHRQSE